MFCRRSGIGSSALIRRRRLDRDLDDELAFHLAMREADYRAAGCVPTPPRERSAAPIRQRDAPEGADARHVDSSLRSKASRRTCATRCARCASRPASRSSRSSRSPSASAATPPSSAWWTRSARGRCPITIPSGWSQLWGNVQRAQVERRGASYPDYLDWRAQSKSFDDMAAGDCTDDAGRQRRTGAHQDRVRLGRRISRCSASSPARGRAFRADEDVVGNAAPVVVLSDGLWKRRFGADPQIIGRTMTLNRASSVHRDRDHAAGLQGADRHRGTVGAVRDVRVAAERWRSAAPAASPRSRG